MSDAASIKVTKQFTFKGTAKRWSNRYHFTNDAPADAAKWLAFANTVTTAEKAALTDRNTIVEVRGYAAGSDVPVYTNSYAVVGTFPVAGLNVMPGEAAALLRYSTGSRSAKNHPIYLFNYFHGIATNSASANDTLSPSIASALTTYANLWIAGFSDGAVSHKRCGPGNDVAIGSYVQPFVTHRDFP